MSSRYNSSNPTAASTERASLPSGDVRPFFSRSAISETTRAPTEVGKVTKQGLMEFMVRRTDRYRDASLESLADSKSSIKFRTKREKQNFVAQSYFEECMSNFGHSMQKYMLAEHETDQVMALDSAHLELYSALCVKPTDPEKDPDYVEMRQQAYIAVLSKYSPVLGFDPGSGRDREYFHANKPGGPELTRERLEKLRKDMIQLSVFDAEASVQTSELGAGPTKTTE